MSAHESYARQIIAARRAILAGQVPISEPPYALINAIERTALELATRRVEMLRTPAATLSKPDTERWARRGSK